VAFAEKLENGAYKWGKEISKFQSKKEQKRRSDKGIPSDSKAEYLKKRGETNSTGL